MTETTTSQDGQANTFKTQIDWRNLTAADSSQVFQYSHSLGPRDTANNKTFIMPLDMSDVKNIIRLHRTMYPSILIDDDDDCPLAPEEMKDIINDLTNRIDTFLKGLVEEESGQGWFLKTNRHSCKDSPLDHPTDSDLHRYAMELRNHPVPSEDIDIDSIDFAPCFEAMCVSRIKSTVMKSGEDVMSLLLRSKRIHDDCTIQVKLCPTPWDFYLAFTAFRNSMASHPLHEFRCYVVARKLRCIVQYSYLIECPISPVSMPHAVAQMAVVVQEYMKSLPVGVADVALDLQCVPLTEDGEEWGANVIEANPLGPGTVWGLVNWDQDSPWILQDAVTTPPFPVRVEDTQGGERKIEWYTYTNISTDSLVRIEDVRNSEAANVDIVVMYTSRHPKGLSLGALAHVPPDYMLIIWEQWGIDKRQSIVRSEKTIESRPQCVLS